MYMYKKFIIIPVLLVVALIFASCSQLDVIGSNSIASFKEVLNAIPDNITADEVNGGWVLTSPDNSVKFFWSKDFSNSNIYDAMLEFDAKPFIDAGLDIKKIPSNIINGDKLIVGKKLSTESITYSGEATPLASYEKIVKLKRESISYHAALDHYGVDLGGGNMFEWAKNINKNDKDIVFVLNPQVFIDAGVNPEKVKGWVFTKVQTMDKDGNKVVVDKFLKPFDLR